MPPEHRTVPDADLLEHLRGEVARHDPAQRPVQHATARFHLGSTLLRLGDAAAAAEQLRAAAEWFPADGLSLEHAKAHNMLGIALRDLGDTAAAATAFETAGRLFADGDHRLEAAAADYNLGLVQRDHGDEPAAAAAFARALEVFTAADARPQAAAAARELGASHLAAGALDEAREALVRAGELARRGGDRPGIGAAANVRGVVELAADRPGAAAEAFLEACGAHPRTVRPAEHAMARSNLALAHERAGRPDHARVAARQALAVAELPARAREQAAAVLQRTDAGEHPLAAVLAATPTDELTGVLRAELARVGGDPSELAPHAATMVVALTPHERRDELAEAWLDVVLEQPPARFSALLEALVRAVEDAHDVRDDLARAVSSAMTHFHVPQWMRLKDTVADIAARHGSEAPWS